MNSHDRAPKGDTYQINLLRIVADQGRGAVSAAGDGGRVGLGAGIGV
jgi:hypothetical protein